MRLACFPFAPHVITRSRDDLNTRVAAAFTREAGAHEVTEKNLPYESPPGVGAELPGLSHRDDEAASRSRCRP